MPDDKRNNVIRAAAIVIHDQKILLMYRRRLSHIYYAFPGGMVEQGETCQEAVLRELYEETCIKAQLENLLYHIRVIDSSKVKEEFFYYCTYVSGVPILQSDSIECKRMESGTEFYEPLWVHIDYIKNMLIYPLEIRDWLVEDVKNGFSKSVKEETFIKEDLRQVL